MQNDILLFLILRCVAFAQFPDTRPLNNIISKADAGKKPGIMETNKLFQDTTNLTEIFMNLNISHANSYLSEYAQHTIRKRMTNHKRKSRRKEKQLRRERFLMKKLRKAEKKKIQREKPKSYRRVRNSNEGGPKPSEASDEDTQNELLAAVDDLPQRSATVEISVKDPGMCRIDGESMCKHGGECNSRDEGGAPVFFCACPPAWGGDFCQEYHDPCAQGIPDCGSAFRCQRDQSNPLAGFTCNCHERLGWAPISVADPRCQRITSCHEGNPCRNGGSCRQEERGFVCVCPENTSGDLCELGGGSGAAADGSSEATKPLHETLILSQVPAQSYSRPYRQSASSDGQFSPQSAWSSYPGYQPLGARAAWSEAGAGAGRRRRWHSEPRLPTAAHLRRRRHRRHRRRHAGFIEQLLKDVEPQIRRTARDSVVELTGR